MEPFTIVNMMFGNAAEWVAALLTGGALIAAVLQLKWGREEATAAREQEHQAMARAVGISASWGEADDQDGWVEGWEDPIYDGADLVLPNLRSVKIEILNSGPYPISGAVLFLAADDNPHEIVYGTILPGNHIKDTYQVPRTEVVFAEVTGGAELHFTDSYGNHWVRSTDSLEAKDAPARIC